MANSVNLFAPATSDVIVAPAGRGRSKAGGKIPSTETRRMPAFTDGEVAQGGGRRVAPGTSERRPSPAGAEARIKLK